MKKTFCYLFIYCFYNFSAQILTTKQENQINLLLASKFPETKLNSNSFNSKRDSLRVDTIDRRKHTKGTQTIKIVHN